MDHLAPPDRLVGLVAAMTPMQWVRIAVALVGLSVLLALIGWLTVLVTVPCDPTAPLSLCE